MTNCSFPGCERVSWAKGLCNSHYAQQRKHGSTSVLGERFVPRALIPHPTDASASLVPLTHGRLATIDNTDADAVGAFNWSWKKSKRANAEYAVTNDGTGPGRRWCSLHRFLWKRWGLPETPQIDHVDTDGLNCRRVNMRAATSSQNRCNTRTRADSRSGIKGVCWKPRLNKWHAQIGHEGKIRSVGYFDDVNAAAAAVAAERKRLHGAFARSA